MKNLNKTAMAILLSTLFLTACGGSDGDNDITPPPVSGGNGGGDNGGDTGGGDNGDGNNDPDPEPNPEYDYSRNGVFNPIVIDNREHFDYETNSRLVVKDHYFESFGTTEQMLYIQDFEWNGEELTMPFTKFLAEIGIDNRAEVLREMFNDCEVGRYSNDEDGFFYDDYIQSNFGARCGGVDINGNRLTYQFSLRGSGDILEYENDWLKKDDTVKVRIYENFEVAFTTIEEYNDDPTQKNIFECQYNSHVRAYTEERGNQTPEKYDFLYTITPDSFRCGEDYIL